MEKDRRDKLARRRRNSVRQPEGNTVLQASDIEILQFIHLYGGMLSTDIIFEYARQRGLYRNKTFLSRRLKVLYHNTGLIDRPKQQRMIERPERFPLIHRVSDKGEEFLKERGLFSEHAPRPNGAYNHQMMTACIYACYFLNAREQGMTFVPQHEFFEENQAPFAINVEGKPVSPDAIFLLKPKDAEGNERRIVVFLEVDRATEPGYSSDDKRKSWGRSVDQYKYIIGQRGSAQPYKDHYRLHPATGAQVHVVTTSPAMKNKIMKQVERVYPNGCTHFFLHATEQFGEITHAPKYFNILNVSWDRFNNPPFSY